MAARPCPIRALEASEIEVEAEDRRAMLDRQRGKMSVRSHIPGLSDRLEQSAEDFR